MTNLSALIIKLTDKITIPNFLGFGSHIGFSYHLGFAAILDFVAILDLVTILDLTAILDLGAILDLAAILDSVAIKRCCMQIFLQISSKVAEILGFEDCQLLLTKKEEE